MTQPVRSPLSGAPERPAGREFIGPQDPRGPQATRAPENTGEPDYRAIQQSPEFSRLRRRLRLFVFPMTAVFFLWYMTYALLSAYAHTFMSHKLWGEINTGTVLGLAQFVSTMAIVLSYQRFARKKYDPEADRINELAGAGKE